MNDPHWRDRAECRGQAEADWFPDVRRGRAGNRPAFTTSIDLILRYCDRCPVLDECRSEAERLERELGATITGIWGGALRYRSRKSADTVETSHVLTIPELRAKLAVDEPDPEPEPEPERKSSLPPSKRSETHVRCRWCGWAAEPKQNGTVKLHTVGRTAEWCEGSGDLPADEQVA